MSSWVLRASLVFFAITMNAAAQTGETAPEAKPQAGTAAATDTGAATSVPPTNAPPTKKVWTNDNLADARGSVSVVGDKRNTKNAGATNNKGGDPATADRIRKDLKKLQGQLDDVNKQLATYKDFQEGEAVSTNVRQLDKNVSRLPVDQQVVALQAKAVKLKQQIDDLLDDARKKGVLPGQLRQE